MLDKIFNFEALLPIMTPVLLIGGMTTGLFTPTEGAIAACVWAHDPRLRVVPHAVWKMFVKVCLDTIETTSTVLFIVAAASIFGWMLTATGVTADIAAWVLGFTKEAWVFLLLANLLMLFVGCFLEPTAAITILVPILLPIAHAAGHRPGPLRPGDGAQPDDRPAASADGHGALRAGARGGADFERTTMAILPWLVPLLLSLVIITYMPEAGTLAAENVLLNVPTQDSTMNPFIRLHPADDVVIARGQLVGGTPVEGRRPSRGLIPPGHKVAVRAIAAGRAGAPLQPDHRLRQQAASRAGEHVHTHNLDMGPTRATSSATTPSAPT